MCNDCSAGGGEGTDEGGVLFGGFEFHSVAIRRLDHAENVEQRLLGAGLIGAEGHVADEESQRSAAADGGGNIDEEIEGDGKGGVMAEDDIGGGVADEDCGEAGFLHEAGHGKVVAGEDGELFVIAAGVAEGGEGGGFVYR